MGYVLLGYGLLGPQETLAEVTIQTAAVVAVLAGRSYHVLNCQLPDFSVSRVPLNPV